MPKICIGYVVSKKKSHVISPGDNVIYNNVATFDREKR